MKVTEQTSKIENTENNIQLNSEDTALLTPANAPFSEILSGGIASNNINLPDIDYNFECLNISIQDAMFFATLVKEGQFTVETTTQDSFQSLIQIETSQNLVTKKTVEVTNQISTLIEKAQSTQKPVRISFDNDVSVILKIDKHGKITAEFIPGSIEVENYLKNNIASLRQKFDEQNLPYNDLLYRQNNKNEKNRKNNKGEH